MVRPENISPNVIEIPEGADIYAISKNWKDSIFFARPGGDTLETFNTINKNDWHRESTLTLENLENSYSILWQRHTHPEELPFIDDECYTNKSDGGFRLPKDEPCDMSKWVELRGESLNDKYAEIETVRQDIINSPSHYADSTIECIDAMEAMMTPEQFIGYLRGNVFKYQWRYEKKNGIEDLKKAQWYLERLTEKVAEKNAPF